MKRVDAPVAHLAKRAIERRNARLFDVVVGEPTGVIDDVTANQAAASLALTGAPRSTLSGRPVKQDGRAGATLRFGHEASGASAS